MERKQLPHAVYYLLPHVILQIRWQHWNALCITLKYTSNLQFTFTYSSCSNTYSTHHCAHFTLSLNRTASRTPITTCVSRSIPPRYKQELFRQRICTWKGNLLNPLWVKGNLNILGNTTKPHYTSLYMLNRNITSNYRI